MDKLNLLHIFCSVVSNGSFAAAANALSMSPSSISKAISRLEADLECTLFHRSTRKLSLSEQGKAYYRTATQILNELSECEEQLKYHSQSPSGTLKLNLPVSYGRIYILPLIAKFQRRYPDIDIHLSFDDNYLDLVDGGYDLSIRSGTLTDKNHYTRKLSPIDFLTCASPAYLARRGLPQSLNELQQHPWISFRFKQTGRILPIHYQSNAEIISFNPQQGCIVDDGEAMAQLCSDQLGLTQIPHFIAKPWIERGDLVSLLPHYRSTKSGVFITYTDKKLLPLKSRVFIDFLSAEIEAIGETPNSTWAEDLPIYAG